MLKKASICLYALVWAGIVADRIATAPDSVPSTGQPVTVQLSRGPFSVLQFPSKMATASALFIFASGDGGWSELEEAIAHTFQDRGYEMIGIDSQAYAQSDYDLQILQTDFNRIAHVAELPYGVHPLPLVVAGYSMGAAQVIAVAGGPNPPPGLMGLLVVDPCSRGRYGLRTSDQWNVLPTGPGTFAVDEFAKTLGTLRVVQWHAQNDSIDSRDWLRSVTAPNREFNFPNAGHKYERGRDDFLHQLVGSAEWILKRGPNGFMAAGSKE